MQTSNPNTIKTIVAGVDFGENSETVIRFACRLAGALGARLNVVHVYETFPGNWEDHLDARAGMATEVRLFDLVEDLCGDIEPQPQTTALPTKRSVADGLASITKHADLLVLGKTSSQGLWGLLKGDTIRAVIERSHCPLLVVPGGCAYQGPRTISVALGHALPSGLAAKALLSIARVTGAKVLVHHLIGVLAPETAERVAARFPGCDYRQIHHATVREAAYDWSRGGMASAGTWLCLNHRGRVTWLGGLRDDLADEVAAKTQVPVLVLVEPAPAPLPLPTERTLLGTMPPMNT